MIATIPCHQIGDMVLTGLLKRTKRLADVEPEPHTTVNPRGRPHMCRSVAAQEACPISLRRADAWDDGTDFSACRAEARQRRDRAREAVSAAELLAERRRFLGGGRDARVMGSVRNPAAHRPPESCRVLRYE